MPTTSHIKLPVQILNWKLIVNPGKLWKIFLQFEVKAARNGNRIFQLVAYPAYKNGKNHSIGKKIPMVIKKPGKTYELKLPLTLGNLELVQSEMKNKLIIKQNTTLEFTPHLYKDNPHAEYLVSDGTNTMVANPSPPAKPAS